jgi:hypothetical protein
MGHGSYIHKTKSLFYLANGVQINRPSGTFGRKRNIAPGSCRSLAALLTDAAPVSLKDVSAAVLTASIADDNAILFEVR